MSKISDHDLSKESIQLQELLQDLKRILNNGSYEVQVSAFAPPAFDAPAEPVLVLSKVGAQVRLYCSYLYVWYYVTLTT